MLSIRARLDQLEDGRAAAPPARTSKLETQVQRLIERAAELEEAADELRASRLLDRLAIAQLLEDRARSLASQEPLLAVSVVKMLAERFSDQLSDGSSGSATKGHLPAPVAPVETSDFESNCRLVEEAITGKQPSQTLAIHLQLPGANRIVLRPKPMKKLLSKASALYASTSLSAHPSNDILHMLGLAFEIEAAGKPIPYAARDHVSDPDPCSVWVTTILEALGKVEATKALRQFMSVVPISTGPDGEAIISPLPKMPRAQAWRYLGWTDGLYDEDDSESEDGVM